MRSLNIFITANLMLTLINFGVANNKFLLYDVNPGEGFNLRRDVFVRLAVLVHGLNNDNSDNNNNNDDDDDSKTTWTLVLPPWGPLYHWQSPSHLTQGHQVGIAWRNFFDLAQINKFVNVMDLDQLVNNQVGDELVVDECIILQNYAEGWSEGGFEEKFDFRPCLEQNQILFDDNKKLYYNIFRAFSKKVWAKEFRCMSIQGTTSVLEDWLQKSQFESVYLGRAENLLHADYGGVQYWQARRSMRFAPHLIQLADDFRAKYLNSDDKRDDTVKSERWEDYKPKRSGDRGGPYLCLHLRRNDYVRSRRGQIPDEAGDAAHQMTMKMQKLNLKKLFLATDASEKEVAEFEQILKKANLEMERFKPSVKQLEEIKDGGVAIVDQIICSHARHFVGSAESTFTFRIQEEREIMGFDVSSTFDLLCPPDNDGSNEDSLIKKSGYDCSKSNIWKIVYGHKRDEL